MCIKSNWDTKKLRKLDKDDLDKIMRVAASRIPLEREYKSLLCDNLGKHQFTAHYICEREEKLCTKDGSIYLNYGNQKFCNINMLLAYYNQKLYRKEVKK